MVLKFYSFTTEPPALIYMGKNKEENEHLIRWGWPEDVWFHVDNISSAHVYLRLNHGMTIDTIPCELLEDCAQLVKANSIKGCKLKSIIVIYTMWENLLKTRDMACGEVGFKSKKLVKKMRVEKKNDEILVKLKKTKIVDNLIDYQRDWEARDSLESQRKKQLQRIEHDKEKDAINRGNVVKFHHDNLLKAIIIN